MNKQLFLSLFVFANIIGASAQQKKVTVLEVPGKNQFCSIHENGASILPSGRIVSPAGNVVRISHDPFGLAISPNGKKAITIHNGVFTIIDIATLTETRVPSYDNTISSQLAHNPLSNSHLSKDTITAKKIASPFSNGSFLGVAFAADSKTVYLSGGDNGAVLIYDIEKFERLDSISLDGTINGVTYDDSFTSDLLLNPAQNELLVLDRGNFRLVRINLSTKKVTASIPAGRQPFGLAISPDAKTALVANVGMYDYPLIKGATPKNYDSIMISRHPYGNGTKESIEGTEVEGRKYPA